MTTKVGGKEMNVNEVWRRRINEDFWSYQEQQQLTDLVIICDDGDIRTHRIVLASFSDFLKNALRDSEDEETSSIHLLDISVSDVSIFLKCLYGNRLPDEGTEDLPAVKKVRVKLHIICIQT